MGEPSAEWVSKEIDLRIAARAGCMAGKKPHNDERHDDRGRRTEQIEGQRQGKVIALAKAMRTRRGRKCTSCGNSGAQRDNRPCHPLAAHSAAAFIRVPEWACAGGSVTNDIPTSPRHDAPS